MTEGEGLSNRRKGLVGQKGKKGHRTTRELGSLRKKTTIGLGRRSEGPSIANSLGGEETGEGGSSLWDLRDGRVRRVRRGEGRSVRRVIGHRSGRMDHLPKGEDVCGDEQPWSAADTSKRERGRAPREGKNEPKTRTLRCRAK